ncbi:class I SAM-dependent methyltransferase [Nostoc sphaeroides CHAB 2801]|uniref:class I SAM-dependent methyltransferase n=1 Tax=Nostoc sphaeroides TaxID=446679 RepID=UPI001C708560|nr:class I SAM-dependent methyltransferase [Nostoc sphaeroides]MCC5628121.1 class I SAM-dependent methyltransferase [Nostoc sphaeroides CHAB 2801]
MINKLIMKLKLTLIEKVINNKERDFLSPKIGIGNIDNFGHRKSIFKALEKTIPDFSGTLLDVGAGYMPYKSLLLEPPSLVEKYIGLDFQDNLYTKPDLIWDGKRIPLADSCMDCAIATEVFEHCPEPEIVIKEILRVLKPGGILFFTVPFLWPLHTVPYDEYRYTPFSLERHLRNAGFDNIQLQALGGWDASLAQMIGLWGRRRFGYSINHKALGLLISLIISVIVLPIVWILYRFDKPPEEFRESSMITGISGTVRKPSAITV